MGIVSIILAALVVLQSGMMLVHCTVMSLIPPMPVPTFPATMPTTAPATTQPATSGGATIVTITTSGSTTPTTTTTTTTTVNMRPTTLTLVLMWLGNGLNLVMCALLLWAGIATLKNQRRGHSLHRMWALFKIPLVFLIAFAEAKYMSGFMSAIFSAMPGQQQMQSQFATPMSIMFIASGAFTVVFGLIYPITVLCLLRARSVRDFFSTSAI